MPFVSSQVSVLESASDCSGAARDALHEKILDIVLTDWMFGYQTLYAREDYQLLSDSIQAIVNDKLPLRFFLPGFPAKSPNFKEKVFGDEADFAEFFALRNVLITLRKLETVYPLGVEFVIMSDYHTFDQYVGVSEEAYQRYVKSIQKIIYDLSAQDVVRLTSLTTYDEFKDVPANKLSQELFERFGDRDFLKSFDGRLKADEEFERSYREIKLFMRKDQALRLPGKRNSKPALRLLREVARGMMNQGVALDRVLKTQHSSTTMVRLSIHNHHPAKGKFAIDLFKKKGPVSHHRSILPSESLGSCCTVGSSATSSSLEGLPDSLTFRKHLATPWHNVVCFDCAAGQFLTGPREIFENDKPARSCLLQVKFGGAPWLYLRLYTTATSTLTCEELEASLDVSIIKGGCGMVFTKKEGCDLDLNLASTCLEVSFVTAALREFGVLVFRGPGSVFTQDQLAEFFDIVNWKFGYIHTINPDQAHPGLVSSHQSLPMHFDMVLPPPYKDTDQGKHRYQDYVPGKFTLYCKEQCTSDEQTTFVDFHAPALAFQGSKTMENFKRTTIQYESYFGGAYEYPLTNQCPSTGKDVLRRCEYWSSDGHPKRTQIQTYKTNSAGKDDHTAASQDKTLKEITLDSRFHFGQFYEEGDLIFINNYTTVDERTALQEGVSSKDCRRSPQPIKLN